MDPTAETGSGVPCALGSPIPYCEANDSAEYWDPAEVGLLALPSKGPKLPDLEWAALLSLPAPADCPGCTLPCGRGGCSYGVTWLPMGVARCKVGKGGLEGAAAWPPTALTLGDGGIDKPNLGVRAPLGLEPGMAGRRSGAGEASCGIGLGVGRDIGVSEEEVGYKESEEQLQE